MIFSQERPFVLVGAGRMGGAMLAGWLADGIDPKTIVICDPSPAGTVAELIEAHALRHVSSVPDDIDAGVVLVAVKPQMMEQVLPSVKPVVCADTLVLSVAAGTPVRAFQSVFGDVAIARAMPNTPAMVGRGITGIYPNSAVSGAQKQVIETLLSAIGQVVWLESEEQIDLVTAVSGSGPAYVFYLAEALAEAGIKAGLPASMARQLAEATVCGAGELMHQSDETPSTLRRNVTSPNGTTAAALEVLMKADGLQELLNKTVEAAARRARELAG